MISDAKVYIDWICLMTSRRVSNHLEHYLSEQTNKSGKLVKVVSEMKLLYKPKLRGRLPRGETVGLAL